MNEPRRGDLTNKGGRYTLRVTREQHKRVSKLPRLRKRRLANLLRGAFEQALNTLSRQ